MKINTLKTLILSAIIFASAISAQFAVAETSVPEVGGQNVSGASESSVPAPAVGGQNVSGGSQSTSSVPPVGGQNVSGGTVATPSSSSVPAVGGQNVSGGSITSNTTSVPPVGGQNVSGGTVVTPSNPGNGNGNNSNTASVANSYSVSSGGGSAYNFNPNTIPAACSYIVTYMKIGGQNNYSDVVRLQSFLKTIEGHTNVDVTGIFDAKTEAAVKVFQSKYASEILAPWGIKDATGNVLYTTAKKINELVCKKSISLTAAQTAQIAASKNAPSNTAVSNGSTDVKPADKVVEIDSKDSTSATTTAPAKTSFFGKAWKFVKWLFGY